MLPTYYVSQMARQHVTVALSGDGGDEMFAGYDRYRIHADRQIFEKIPGWARKFYRDQVFPRLPNSLQGRKLSYNITLPWQERYVDGLSFLPAFERDTPLLSDDFRAILARSDDPANVLRRRFAAAPAKDPVSEILYVDTKTYMVDDILAKVDRMSMLNSLEVRVPILDHVFVEWVAGLAPEWKLRGKQQKYILRKLAERIGVPARSALPPEAGILSAARPLDAQRTQRYVDGAGRTANPRTRILPGERRAQAYGRPSSARQNHDRPPLAPADVRTLAPQLPREIRQARRLVLAPRSRRFPENSARRSRVSIGPGRRMTGWAPRTLPS